MLGCERKGATRNRMGAHAFVTIVNHGCSQQAPQHFSTFGNDDDYCITTKTWNSPKVAENRAAFLMVVTLLSRLLSLPLSNCILVMLAGVLMHVIGFIPVLAAVTVVAVVATQVAQRCC